MAGGGGGDWNPIMAGGEEYGKKGYELTNQQGLLGLSK